jgi:hypothetical protein
MLPGTEEPDPAALSRQGAGAVLVPHNIGSVGNEVYLMEIAYGKKKEGWKFTQYLPFSNALG